MVETFQYPWGAVNMGKPSLGAITNTGISGCIVDEKLENLAHGLVFNWGFVFLIKGLGIWQKSVCHFLVSLGWVGFCQQKHLTDQL